MKITVELIERFSEKWELNKDNGCWEWQHATSSKGYGQIKIPKQRKQIPAHRLSYLIHYGEIPDGMLVCHKCDNPKCVRPSHLFLGSYADNSQDMAKKDRHLFGEKHPHNKLTEIHVRRIHSLFHDDGVSQGKIAQIYGIGQSTVWKILHGYRWEKVYNSLNDNRNETSDSF